MRAESGKCPAARSTAVTVEISASVGRVKGVAVVASATGAEEWQDIVHLCNLGLWAESR